MDHMYTGKRGDTYIEGLTYHQLHDMVLAGYNRARMMPDDADVYQAGADDDIDPTALAQNVCNLMEQLQGIYPNIPRVKDEPLRDAGGTC